MNYFITATDTSAGKTYVTRLLIEGLRRKGINAVGYKPVCCGDRDDAHQLVQAGQGQVTLDEVNPVWYKTPASPLAASWIENRGVDLKQLVNGLQKLTRLADTVLVEGAGGWEVPLTASETMADFSQLLGLPVIVVVNNKLGALNHTLLTVRNIESRGMHCAGLILNHVSDERDPASISHRAILERILPGVPVLTEVLHDETELAVEFLLPA